jgi:hypothetical protein
VAVSVYVMCILVSSMSSTETPSKQMETSYAMRMCVHCVLLSPNLQIRCCDLLCKLRTQICSYCYHLIAHTYYILMCSLMHTRSDLLLSLHHYCCSSVITTFITRSCCLFVYADKSQQSMWLLFLNP